METTKIWEKYKNGVAHHQSINLYAETERNWNFFIGDQWKGVALGNKGYTPPSENIIKPIVKSMYSTVAMQKRSIVYSDMSQGGTQEEIISALNDLAQQEWEKGKIDTLMWQVIKRSAIAGDSYLYLHETRKQEQGIVPNLKPQIEHQLIHNTNIYFADEQNPNINEQQYIIISERLSVEKVQNIAKSNGISEEKIALIISDDDLAQEVGDVTEVNTEKGKCTSLLYFEKTDNGIKYNRSTAQVVYDEGILPINIYPIVGMRWEEMIGTARGVSAVKHLIPNQCAINYTLYRREQTIKRTAFPKMVYDINSIQNIDKLAEVGSSIAVESMADRPVNTLVSYLNPAPISNDASNFQAELTQLTRELAGAGDATTGQIDPTKTSGEAIKAARDAAALQLNEQIATQLQMIEDLANLWFKMWVAYSVNGLEITAKDEKGQDIKMIIQQEDIKDLEPNIKVDISPVDPYSIMAEDNNLLSMLGTHITFEEFVEALPANTNLPKAKLEDIVNKRMAEQQVQQLMQEKLLAQQMAQGAEQIPPMEQEVIANEMPVM